MLSKLEAVKRSLVVDVVGNRTLELGARNLPGVKMVVTKDVTTYDLLGAKHVLLSEAAAKKLSEALA